LERRIRAVLADEESGRLKPLSGAARAAATRKLKKCGVTTVARH
jgi:hypothetical protein